MVSTIEEVKVQTITCQHRGKPRVDREGKLYCPLCDQELSTSAAPRSN